MDFDKVLPLLVSKKTLGRLTPLVLITLLSLEISCYHCSSNISLDDCIKHQSIVDCPIPVHRCATTKYTDTTKKGKVQTTYHKGCATNDHCKKSSTKDVECCHDNQCNTSNQNQYFCPHSSTNCLFFQ